jgi:hypothetical protein
MALPVNRANEFDGLFLPARKRRSECAKRNIRPIDVDSSRNRELPESPQNPLKSKAKSFDGLRVGKRPSIEGNMLVKSESYGQKEQ